MNSEKITLDEIATESDEDESDDEADDEETRRILAAIKRGDISVDEGVEMLD